MSKIKRYTPDEKSFIRHALSEGYLEKDLAAFFGISASGIHTVIYRHDLKPPTQPKAGLDDLARQYNLLSVTAMDGLKEHALQEYQRLQGDC